MKKKKKNAIMNRLSRINQKSLEISSSDIFIDENMQNFPQAKFRNNDQYFSEEEMKYYENLYKHEKIELNQLTEIK